MMKVTEDTKLKDFCDNLATKAAAPFLVGCTDLNFIHMIEEDSVKKMGENPSWGISDMLYGAERFVALAENGQVMYSVYSEEQIKQNPEKECVKLFYFQAEEHVRKHKKFVLLAAGGAYRNVCTFSEAFPIAAKLNELGITVFCLNYRTISEADSQGCFMPKPLDDVAAALQFIKTNEEKFQVNAEEYVIGGCSAGGHLSGMWGTEKHGYRSYGLAAPEAIFLDYAYIGSELREEDTEFYKGMLGTKCTPELIEEYSIDKQVDQAYPPTFLVQCEDDFAVPIGNLIKMAQALEAKNVLHQAEKCPKGGHGYGLGSETDAAGWVERAVDFWMNRAV